jgi:hypothetical protein
MVVAKMKKEDCRPGMVVYYTQDGGVRAVVVKCNPRNARVRTIEKSARTGPANSLWNMPYRLLEPFVKGSISTEMVMKSFEDPENEGIKTYIAASSNDSSLDFPEESPEHHILQAICELWRRLDDDNLERECKAAMDAEAISSGPKRRPSTVMRDVQGRYSNMINKLFSALGREVSRSAAEHWEKDRKQKIGTV